MELIQTKKWWAINNSKNEKQTEVPDNVEFRISTHRRKLSNEEIEELKNLKKMLQLGKITV